MSTSTATPRRRRLELPMLVGGLVIGSLVTGGLVPLVGSDRTTSLAQGGSTSFLEGGESGAPGTTEPGAGLTPGLPGEPLDGAAGTPSTGGGFTGPGALGGPTGGGTTGGGTTGGGTTGGGTTGGGTTGGGTTGGAPRTASDIGITKDVIKVGAATLNCKACAAFGVDINTRPQREYAQAFADDINRRGGINGRKVQLFTADYDPVEDGTNGGGTERAACLELTRNRKVFAVVSGVIAQNACFYDENKTPLINNFDSAISDPDTFNRVGGRVWLVQATPDRVLLDFAAQLSVQKLLTPSTKWGLVDSETSHPVVKKRLLAELARRGLKPTRVSVLPADPSTLQVKIAQEVPAMKNDGVTHVVFTTSFIPSQFWVREATRNNWKPQYLLSDFPSSQEDFSGGQVHSGGDFIGAIALSSATEATLEQRRSEPGAKQCFETYTKNTGRQVNHVNEVGPILSFCVQFGLFEAAMKSAGVNPVRQGYLQGLAGLGRFPLAGYLGSGSFGGRYPLGAVKWSAIDFGQRKVWRSPCPRAGDDNNACWVPVGPVYRMAA